MKLNAHRYFFTIPSNVLLGLMVFVFAFAVRGIFISDTAEVATLHELVPGLDMDLRWEAAKMLREETWENSPAFELMLPSSSLFPYLLSGTQVLLGENVTAHRWLMALIGSFNAVLVFLLLSRLCRYKVIVTLVTIIWLLTPSLIFFDTVLHKISLLFTFLLAGVLLVVTTKNTIRNFAITALLLGVMGGCVYLLQQDVLLFFFVGWLVLVGKNLHLFKQNRLLYSGFSVGAVLLFVLVFFGVETGGINPQQQNWFKGAKGAHIAVGNHPEADGMYKPFPDLDPWPYGHYFDARMMAEAHEKRPLNQHEVDHYFLGLVWQYIEDDPWRMLTLSFRKFAFIFSNYEPRGAEYLYFYERFSKLLQFNPLGVGVLMIFSGLGLLSLWKKDRSIFFLCLLLVGACVLPRILTFVSWRYRMPLLIPLIVLSAVGVEYFYLFVRGVFKSRFDMRMTDLKKTTAVLVLILIPTSLTYASFHSDMAVLTSMKNEEINEDVARASRREQRTVEQYKTGQLRPAHRATDKGLEALNRLHRHSEAYVEAKAAFEKGERSLVVVKLYVNYLCWMGDYELAAQVLSQAHQRSSGLFDAVVRKMNPAERAVYESLIKPELNING